MTLEGVGPWGDPGDNGKRALIVENPFDMVSADDPQTATLNEVRQQVTGLCFEPAAPTMCGDDPPGTC